MSWESLKSDLTVPVFLSNRFFIFVGCAVAITSLQPKSTADHKTAVSAKPTGRRRVKRHFFTSSILKKNLQNPAMI
jgi:hypothetical protein